MELAPLTAAPTVVTPVVPPAVTSELPAADTRDSANGSLSAPSYLPPVSPIVTRNGDTPSVHPYDDEVKASGDMRNGTMMTIHSRKVEPGSRDSNNIASQRTDTHSENSLDESLEGSMCETHKT